MRWRLLGRSVLLSVQVATLVAVTLIAQPRALADVRPIYRPPVDAPVADPFRAPPHPWSPGNRGIEYTTAPGGPVRSIGPGRVVFAGPVAGSLHVTLLHPDGLRSSYSFLAAVRVGDGDVVDAGDLVGIAGARLHVGVRRGDHYIDPASLWGRAVGHGRPHLVPEPSEFHDRGVHRREGGRGTGPPASSIPASITGTARRILQGLMPFGAL